MVAGGPRWVSGFVEAQRPEHSQRIERTLQRIANAVGNYVGGALLQATIAGLTAFIVLTILGAPFAGPLALLVFFFDLIPVVGATIAAFLVAIVMVFVNFPIALIIWVVFAIAYQQFENYVIQPQIQKRATEIDPFLVLVAVLFGSTLFGVIGAILAIPAAAAILITFSEWRRYLRDSGEGPGRDHARRTGAAAPAAPASSSNRATAGHRGPLHAVIVIASEALVRPRPQHRLGPQQHLQLLGARAAQLVEHLLRAAQRDDVGDHIGRGQIARGQQLDRALEVLAAVGEGAADPGLLHDQQQLVDRDRLLEHAAGDDRAGGRDQLQRQAQRRGMAGALEHRRRQLAVEPGDQPPRAPPPAGSR